MQVLSRKTPIEGVVGRIGRLRREDDIAMSFEVGAGSLRIGFEEARRSWQDFGLVVHLD